MPTLKAVILAVCLAFATTPASAADLRIGVASEVTTLDPHFFHLTSNTEIHKGLYSGLVTQDADMKVVPDLAISWRTIDDTHWEFKLRPGVVFHDGTPLTGDDVVFTYQRARDVPNAPGSFLQYLKHVTKTSSPDPLTVVVETDGPDPILLNELQNVWIVSRKNGAGAASADYNSGKAAIGTGPYKLAEWVPGDHITLQRFEGYFGPKPDWERVTYRAITNDAARTAALLSGDVDLIASVPGNDLPNVRANPALLVSTMQSNRCFFWTVDVDRDVSPLVTDSDGRPMTKNPLKDVRVRRAMSKALDRNALVSRVMQGQGVPASQFMPDGVPGTDPNLKPEPYDLEGAKELLAEAGHPQRLRPDGRVDQRSLHQRRRHDSGGGTDVEPPGVEDRHQHVAEGGVFPARRETGVQRAAQRQFDRHQRTVVATRLSVGHVRRQPRDRRRQLRPLLQPRAG